MKKVVGHPHLRRDNNGAIVLTGKSKEISRIREKKSKEKKLEERVERIENLLEILIQKLSTRE